MTLWMMLIMSEMPGEDDEVLDAMDDGEDKAVAIDDGEDKADAMDDGEKEADDNVNAGDEWDVR